ncbi:MAG: hypothetical protein J6S23_03555 [Clostridia bacterium]|nr:hypothetical protein [Clostridia bacterium]
MENTNLAKKIDENRADAEKLLLEVINADEEAYEAKFALLQIYGTGELVIEGKGAISIPGFPNMEKFKAFISENIEDETDVRNMVYSLYYEFIYHNCNEMPIMAEKVMETALCAVESPEDDEWAENGLAKAILFCFYYDGVYKSDDSFCDIVFPVLKNHNKAKELIRYEAVKNIELNPRLLELLEEREEECEIADLFK